MDGIERADLRGHRLRGSLEDDGVDLDELEGGRKLQDRRAPAGDLRIRQPRAEPKPIQRARALRGDEGAGDAAIDPPPLGQHVGSPQGDARQHGTHDVALALAARAHGLPVVDVASC